MEVQILFPALKINYNPMVEKQNKPRRRFFRRKHDMRQNVKPGAPTKQPARGFEFSDKSGKKPKLRIIPIGGLEEVGRNCTLLECGQDIIIIDMGLQFPEEDMPGIDYIIPNLSYLRGKEKNIRGVIITHGHYDHIGGIPHLMGKIGNPVIYTAALTAGIIKKRNEEYRQAPPLKVQIIKSLGEVIQLGRNFVFEPFHINHNIFDAFGAFIRTPYGNVVMTGDFKFDHTPVNDDPVDLDLIASYGARGVLALMSDSTSAESPGRQLSERQVGEELEKIFQMAKARIIVGTFSSLLIRAQQLITLAEKYGRRVLFVGRSMINNVELAHKLGYIKIKPGTIIEDKEFKRMPNDKVIVVCTGAQGEKNAALMRIANDDDRLVHINRDDMVIFSSSVIPGNERTVQSLKDTLVRKGAKVIHTQMMDVHAGGHAKQEDLKEMIQLIKPKYFIPIHGNRFLLQAHAELAKSVGVPEDHIFIADNGQVIEFTEAGGRLSEEKVMTDYVMVDGLGVGDVSHIVLRDRRMLAEDGMFVVIVTIDTKTGDLIGNPDIISRGFVYLRESKELIEKARAKVKKMLRDSDPNSPAFEDYIKNKIRNEIGEFLFSQTKRRPMILPVLIEV